MEACEASGIALEDGRTLFSWLRFQTLLSPADVASLEADMAFLLDAGLCPRPVDLRAAMWEATTA